MRFSAAILTLLVGAGLGEAGDRERAGSGRTTRAGQAAPEKPLEVAVELRDGSRLIGVPAIKALSLQTGFTRVEIPLRLVEQVEFAEDLERVKVSCFNGDLLHGVLNLGEFPLRTSFGKVSVPLKDIARITAQSRTRQQGLVLYYSFDRDEGPLVTDQSGKGNHGKARGTGWTAQGKVGGARVFNGESDCISRDFDPASGLFPTDTPLSVAAWFKTSSATPKHQTIVTTHYAGSGWDGFFLIVDARDYEGKVFWSPGSFSSSVFSKAPVNGGRWHHAVGTWDCGQSSLYIDGVLQGSVAAVSSLNYQHRAPFRIGHAANNGAPHARDEFYYFRGAIDEVMIFNRSLTAEEVRQLYRGGAVGAAAD
jgi:hypothetical protein